MFRLHCSCNDEFLGELIALLAKTGKVIDIKHNYSPGRIEVGPEKAAAQTAPAAEKVTREPKRTRDPNAPTLQNLAKSSVLDFARQFHHRRIEGTEVMASLKAETSTDKSRVYTALRDLINDGVLVRTGRGEYELSETERVRHRLSLNGGADHSEQPQPN